MGRIRNRLRRQPVDTPLTGERSTVFERFSAASELPMMILTLIMIPTLIIPFAVHNLDP